MTMNSPESLVSLFRLATTTADHDKAVRTTELMREVGLKCISFNGIPRTINCLGAFRAALPKTITEALCTAPTREPSPRNIEHIHQRGFAVWNSIYAPFEVKLYDKLAESHPDLPVHILNSHYGALLSDPEDLPGVKGVKAGRVLTSIIAISCLRAQTGVGPQVTSHIFGLRKAFEDGSYAWKGEQEVEGAHWLASDEGNIWILKCVDTIVNAIGEGRGSSFAPGMGNRL